MLSGRRADRAGGGAVAGSRWSPTAARSYGGVLAVVTGVMGLVYHGAVFTGRKHMATDSIRRMSVTLWLALLTQAVTVWLLRLGLGKRWLLRPATVLVLASVVYDGVSQVLLAFPSVLAADQFRDGITAGWVATGDLLLSGAMLAFTAGFLITGRRPHAPVSRDDVAAAVRVLDWRVLAALSLPLAVLTYAGRGYGALHQGTGPPSPSWASTFFVITVTLAASAFVLRHSRLLPALAVQTAVLAAAGERTPLIAGALAVMTVTARAGKVPSRRQVLACAAAGAAVLLAITGVRAHSGRAVFESDTGFSARAAALASGLTASPQPGTPGLAAQAAARLDGVSFTAGILQSHAAGQPLLGPGPAVESLLLPMPKALWPAKPETGALDAYQEQIAVFGLAPVNYLPGLPGLLTGCLPWPWLILVMGMAGALWGSGERWVMARLTVPRLALTAGLVLAAADYEAGAPTMLVLLRAAAAVAVLAAAAGPVLRSRLSQERRTCNSSSLQMRRTSAMTGGTSPTR